MQPRLSRYLAGDNNSISEGLQLFHRHRYTISDTSLLTTYILTAEHTFYIWWKLLWHSDDDRDEKACLTSWTTPCDSQGPRTSVTQIGFDLKCPNRKRRHW